MPSAGKDDNFMSEINVTPFVDVMLVLLIIFMVTAPMMTQGVDVSLPEASTGPISKNTEKDLVITIDKTGQVSIDSQVIQVDYL